MLAFCGVCFWYTCNKTSFFGSAGKQNWSKTADPQNMKSRKSVNRNKRRKK